MRDARVLSSRAASYFEEIRCFPMLKAEEEYSLAVRWRERGDGKAAHQLLNSHLRLVAKIAMAYRSYGLPTSDLISEGNIGLLQAIERFDPNRGVRFSTYAIWWIKAAIENYIVRSWSLVEMGATANQKKLFFHLPKAKRRLSALRDGDLRPDEVTLIANDFGVTEQDVVEMNRRLSGDVSLNVSMNEDDDSVEWQDRLVEEGSDQESHLAESEVYDPQGGARPGPHGPRRPRTPHLRGAPAGRYANHARAPFYEVSYLPRAGPAGRNARLQESSKGRACCERAYDGYG